MTPNRKLVLALLAGVAIGVGGAAVIHARQVKPAHAYIVAEAEAFTGDPTNPTNLANLKEYAAKLDATLAPFPHKFVARGKPISLEGEPPKVVVVIEFESVEKAQAWYDSAAYQAIKPLRQSASTGRMFIVDGVAGQ